MNPKRLEKFFNNFLDSQKIAKTNGCVRKGAELFLKIFGEVSRSFGEIKKKVVSRRQEVHFQFSRKQNLLFSGLRQHKTCFIS